MSAPNWVGEQGPELITLPDRVAVHRVIRTPVIGMDIFFRRLSEEQRDDLRALIARMAPLRGTYRFEYLLIDGVPTLRLTSHVKNERGVSMLDPSCTCGPGGRAIHLWDLTMDNQLTEPLPRWWIPAKDAL